MTTQTLTTSDSSPWSTPTGAYNLVIECWGAGGGGGGANSGIDGGAGGGGGGAYSKLTISSPTGNYSFVVGAGGAGGSGNVNGSAGDDTWFVSNDAFGCVAKGGAGGYRQSGASPDARGGAGGLAANGYGDVKYDGGYGEYGRVGSVNGYGGYGGSSAGTGADGVADGASPAYSTPTFPDGTEPAGAGVGGDGGGLASSGNAPDSGYGGGGGGSGDATPGTGGSGADGKIILTWDVASGDTDVDCTTASLILTTYGAAIIGATTVLATCKALTLTKYITNVGLNVSFTTLLRTLNLITYVCGIDDGKTILYGDWKDYKNEGPWEFTEQGDKWGYLNNPRWQPNPSKIINYSDNRSAEPQVWNLPGSGYSSGSSDRHIPCGHWHKVVVPSTPYIPPEVADVMIYVCDSNRGKTLKWDMSYIFDSEIDSYGRAIDIEDDEVFTLAYGAPIMVTDLSGNLLRTIGSHGTGDGQWEQGWDMCVYNGYVYVVDAKTYKCIVYDTAGNYVSSFNTRHLLGGSWGTALGIEVTSSLIYCSTGFRVQMYNTSGTYLGYFGAYGTGPGKFVAGYRMQAYDDTLYILVTNGNDTKISIWSLAGTFMSEFPISSEGVPHGFFIYDDKVYIVYSVSNHGVRVYTTSGEYIDRFGTSGGGTGEFLDPHDCCVYEST